MKHIIIIASMAVLLAGCDREASSIAGRVGQSIGSETTDFATGVGRGIDKKLTAKVSLSPQVQTLGLSNTIAKPLGSAGSNGVAFYFIASQPVSNTLVARALNVDDAEIGRARKQVALQKDDASYVTFNFDAHMDISAVHRYEIGLGQ